MNLPKPPRNSHRREPYWNFWKVFLVGCLIRYSGSILSIIRIPLILLVGVITMLVLNVIEVPDRVRLSDREYTRVNTEEFLEEVKDDNR